MYKAAPLTNDVINIIINDNSFTAIYERYWKELFALSFYYLQDEDEAKECVQNIFKSIWERREKLKIEGPVAHYLTRSVKLKVAEYYRTKDTRKNHLEKFACLIDHSDYSTEQTLRYNELKAELGTLITNLPVQCRRVYMLSREQGLRNRDIAEQLIISEKTVKNHLTKALSFLKIHLSK